MSPRSFADPETHFALVRSETPVDVDGYKLGEPAGEVQCAECDAIADNVDEIPHRPTCPQRWVRSRWWAERFRGV
jgi:hypothetical protein